MASRRLDAQRRFGPAELLQTVPERISQAQSSNGIKGKSDNRSPNL